MTKKRFKMIENDLCYVMLDNRKPMSKEKIIDLLNEQHEENEQCKCQSNVNRGFLWYLTDKHRLVIPHHLSLPIHYNQHL